MTIYKVVAIRDRALDAFGRPAFVPTLGAAIRGFADEINNAQGEMSKHPDDYDLYELGAFDDEKGTFTQVEAPRQIAIGKDQVRAP